MLSSSLKRTSSAAISLTRNRPSPFIVLRQRSGTTTDEVSGKSESAQVEKGDSESSAKNHDKEPGQRKKTSEELDEELCEKLEAMSGEGGAAGLEYENGKPVAMKRSVRSNMFRLI